MARPGISKLGLPPRKYRPDLRTTRRDGVITFESEEASYDEDKFRIAQLERVERLYPDLLDPRSVRALRGRLEEGVWGESPIPTLASSLYMRQWRIRIVGWLWSLYDSPRNAPVTTAHILPTGWIIPAKDLMLVKPEMLMNCLRCDLNRLSAKAADGFLFAFLHGEYNPEDDCFHLHAHCLVSKGMIDVVKKLRNREKARLLKFSNSITRTPVKIRATLRNLPNPLSYCCQSYWPKKGYLDPVTGDWKRGKKHRIPEPYHSLFLLWIDQWELEDLTLMMKLSVRAGRLEVSR